MTIRTVNPATGEAIREYEEHSEAELENRLRMAEDAFALWRRTSFNERSERMRRIADILREQSEPFARLMTEEMGKPIVQARAEIEKCAWVCEFYAENAERLLAEEPISTEASQSFVRYEPLGPILAIMPWNFPFWQVFRFAAPAVMAGNVGVLKHAPNVCGTALAIEELFSQAGFPTGVLTAVLIAQPNVPVRIGKLIEHPAIRGVTLTGSDRAGSCVGAEAGRHLKKTVLELGGSDPFLVLSDADAERVAREAARARTVNSGQSCIAAKRFIVEEPVADRFERAFVQEMEKLRAGDPMDEETQIGPIAREDLLENLHDQVQRSIAAGATLRTGGRRLDRKGYYYASTVLAGVEPGMAAFDEETFGPVAALIRARDRRHAVELASRSKYGLAASIWTADPGAAADLVPELDVGFVAVNQVVQSDPRLPFGGVKRSGYGRELGAAGIREFVNVKTVVVE